MSLKSDFMGEKSQIILQQVKEGEVSAYRAGDLVLTVSDEDAARVQQISHVSADVVEQLPFTEEIGEPSLVPFKDRTGVVFVGSGHNGNVEVVDSLIKDIMPLLCARIPNVTLHLVGSPKWIKMAQGKPCVHGTGEVDSVLPFLQTSRVFLNPMVNMGSGISTKSFLALAHGLPIVTTKHGLRGLCYKKRTCPGVSVGNDATTFAAEVEKLYTSEEIWQRASGDARKFAQENISVESVAKKESRLKGMLRSLGMAGCAKANSDGPSWLSRPNNWVGRL
ncbi:hypothetical protein M427DRAFT_67346 [Gonapodya prolifera JEL478]|uniref:Glycosyltransferase family 1 protein n=1 Tax=Gonapodya prolifera (strain JEL478) TaxID=1344416 RepID=A0A139AR76_GONPJ|nr:hypothetical protein M427DRAFT_67346 [Gonapodya prolifera JEL478]|eukprot:KXS19229.1 hypothetical protein M427DRAFT_67346 [Gonapodya prolifera JEL478]